MNIRIRVQEADLYPDPRRYVAISRFDEDRSHNGENVWIRDEVFNAMTPVLKH